MPAFARSLFAALGALLVLAGLAAVPSAAASSWTGYETVRTGENGWRPVGLVVDDYARATLVLTKESGSAVDLYASRRTATGSWSAPVHFGPLDRPGLTWSVAAAGSAKGVVTVAYSSHQATGQANVYAVVYVPGSGWSAPRRLGSSRYGEHPEIASNAAGRTVVGWTEYSADLSKRWVRTASHTAGRWEPSVTHIGDGGYWLDGVAVDASGNEAVAWSGAGVRVRYRPAGAAWSTNWRLNDRGLEADVALVRGRITATWVRQVGTDSYGDPTYGVFSRNQSSSGWSTSHRLTATTADVSRSRLAVDPDGRAVVMWAGRDGTAVARYRRLDGTWTGVVTVVPAWGMGNELPELRVDSRGIWHLLSNAQIGDDSLRYQRKPNGAGWTTPLPLNDYPHQPDGRWFLAMAPGGRLAVAWHDGSSYLPNIYSRSRVS